MAEEASNEYTPPAFNFTDEASPSTSRDNTQGASSALGAYPTISDDAWPFQWNTQHRPTTDGTYNLDGVTENASTSSLLLGSNTSIDNEMPSTSRPGMEQATAILEHGARFPETTSVGKSNKQYHTVDGTSSVSDNTEDRSNAFRLPVYSSSSSGGDDAVASTSRAGMQDATGTLGNESRSAIGSRARELQELCGVSGNGSSGRGASHGHPSKQDWNLERTEVHHWKLQGKWKCLWSTENNARRCLSWLYLEGSRRYLDLTGLQN
ncbi:uncharacterized protein [Dermacentor andersoni]|uniref:uncharacterized protein n=1 Tax=Dermacentor andersoni TaxID=34620 RepID=UPI00241632BE|nr:uncharacterized protein LOC129381615 [Dermacentor andersoni]